MNRVCSLGFLVIAICDFVISLPEPGKKKFTISNVGIFYKFLRTIRHVLGGCIGLGNFETAFLC